MKSSIRSVVIEGVSKWRKLCQLNLSGYPPENLGFFTSKFSREFRISLVIFSIVKNLIGLAALGN